MRAVMVSEDWWSGLSDDDRAAIEKAIEAGVAANRAWVVDWATKVEAKFAEAGVTVTQLAPGERDKMRALAQTVHPDVLSVEALAAYNEALAKVRK